MGNKQHNHNHNQTGSNYDELPLEFIHNIPQNTNNADIAPANNINLGGYPSSNNPQFSGYQEIEFNDHDDNISSVPSNADSYRTGNKTQPSHSMATHNIAIGSVVKVFDHTLSKWVEAEVEKLDPIQHNV